MGIVSYLNCIEKVYTETERNKNWKILFTNLKLESDKLNEDIKINEAKDPKNKIRNRYRDVLPYDHSRVLVAGIDESDYINASYVQLNCEENQRLYILTQGPLTGTVSHFWRMIWNERSACIVMLNKLIEKDMVKCAQYFPDSVDETVCHDYSDLSLSVSLLQTIDKGAYTYRVLSLTDKLTNEIRRVVQFHYLSWPDFGVPMTPMSFLQFLSDVRLSGGMDDRERPCVIHCSAGIGRSGTFVLIDLALLMIAGNVANVDLQAMILELRKCRMGLIQAPEQLRFAYLAVIFGAKSMSENDSSGNINFDYHDTVADPEGNESSSSEIDSDSNFSDDSDIMRSNSALDKAAAAVRTRRGIPLADGFEDTIVISQSNNNCSEVLCIDSDIIEERKQIRATRCNRTRQMVEELRSSMRRQDLERARLVKRFRLKRLTDALFGHTRQSFTMRVSAIVGVLSLACGWAVYKYVG